MAEHVFSGFPIGSSIYDAPLVMNGAYFDRIRAASIAYGSDLKDATVLDSSSRVMAASHKTATLTAEALHDPTLLPNFSAFDYVFEGIAGNLGGSTGTDNTGAPDDDDQPGGFMIVKPGQTSIVEGVTTCYCGESLYSDISLGAAVGDALSYELTAQCNALGNGVVMLADSVTGSFASISGPEPGIQLGALSSDQRMMVVAAYLSWSDHSSPTAQLNVFSDDSAWLSKTERLGWTVPTFTGPRIFSFCTYIYGPISDDYWQVTMTNADAGSTTLTGVVALAVVPKL